MNRNIQRHKEDRGVCRCSRRGFLGHSLKSIIGAAIAAGALEGCNRAAQGIIGDDEIKIKTIDITDVYYNLLGTIGAAVNIWLNDETTGELLPLIGYRLNETRVLVFSAICPHQYFVMRLENIDGDGVLLCTNHMSRFDLRREGAVMEGGVSPVPLVIYPTILQDTLLTIFKPA